MRSAAKARAESDYAAGDSQNRTFEKQPQRDVSAPGAESRTDRQFLSAAFNPHQQQVGNVGACNQQHHNNRTHQDPKDISYIADDILFEGVEVCADLTFSKSAALNPSGAGKL